MGLNLPQVDVASKWLLQPKSVQISLEASNGSGYPSLLSSDQDDADGDVAPCNQKRTAYSSAWAQAALCSVLLAREFLEVDPQIFKLHNILKSNAAAAES